MMTGIEIAQSVTPRNILDIARDAGIDEKHIELYGTRKAKLDLSLLSDLESKADGKLVLVTAINPTPAAEKIDVTDDGKIVGLF